MFGAVLLLAASLCGSVLAFSPSASAKATTTHHAPSERSQGVTERGRASSMPFRGNYCRWIFAIRGSVGMKDCALYHFDTSVPASIDEGLAELCISAVSARSVATAATRPTKTKITKYCASLDFPLRLRAVDILYSRTNRDLAGVILDGPPQKIKGCDTLPVWERTPKGECVPEYIGLAKREHGAWKLIGLDDAFDTPLACGLKLGDLSTGFVQVCATVT
jgi:hypothetical protein